MVQVQIDIPEDLNKKLRHYMIDNEYKSKEEAIHMMIEKFLDTDENRRD